MYYILVEDGIVKTVGQMTVELREIGESDYQTVQHLLDNKPKAPDWKHDYRLTENLEWELFEIEFDDKDVDAAQAFEILTGGAE